MHRCCQKVGNPNYEKMCIVIYRLYKFFVSYGNGQKGGILKREQIGLNRNISGKLEIGIGVFRQIIIIKEQQILCPENYYPC